MSLFGLFDALKPAEVVAGDGTRLAAVVAPAQGEQRGVVVFCHGFTGSKEDFVLVLPDLAARGWTAVAYDSRGTYESQATGPYTLARMGADLVDVAGWAAATYGGAVHLVGHSFGGLVAQTAVAQTPDAFASLTLMCTGPAGVRVIGADEQEITIGRARDFHALLTSQGVEAAWRAKSELENLDEDNPFIAFLRERFVRTDRDLYLGMLEALLDAPDLVPGVVATGVPVRWCFGEGDGSWSQANQRATAARYDTEAAVIPAPAAHSPCIENDEATTAWLDATLTALG